MQQPQPPSQSLEGGVEREEEEEVEEEEESTAKEEELSLVRSLLSAARGLKGDLEKHKKSVAASYHYLDAHEFSLLHGASLVLLHGDAKQHYRKAFDAERKRKSRRRRYI